MVVDTSEWFKRLAENAGESRDGKGSADHDVPYTFGHPRTCLTVMQQARLTIMRGYVLDASRAAPTVRYGGDSDYVYPMPSGLLVPTDPNTYWGDDE